MSKITRNIFIFYVLACLVISISSGIENGFSDITEIGGNLVAMILFPFIIWFFILGLFDDDNSYSSSSSKDKYLDVASATRHGMSAEDIVKYNTGDWDTRSKYREKALYIDKSDEFYMG